MTQPNGFADLDAENWNRLQDLLERFEKDCARSFPRDLQAYLPPPGDSLRPAVLEELVRTDLELQWRRRHGRQQGVLVEHYIDQFPELKTLECVPTLLHDEYRIRRQAGDQPRLEDYEKRFPEHYARFVQLTKGTATVDSFRTGMRTANSAPPPSPNPVADAVDANDSSFMTPAKFKKIRKIGEGAFGEVWEAQAPGGVPVAIKKLFGAVSARAVQRERASLDLICSGKLRHPFLLQVFGWWIQEGQLHIAMELADASLDDRLQAARRAGQPGLPIEELKQVMIDAADALDFLNHQQNVLHRDIKPANMLLMANRLKLCDFGLSRMTENLAIATGKTMGAGTPVFIAPEIINGQQSIHSDQYSLAATYYLLRTGRPIFSGKVEAIRQQHLFSTPAFQDDILSEHEKKVLLRALSKDPDDRYDNSTQFVTELLELDKPRFAPAGLFPDEMMEDDDSPTVAIRPSSLRSLPPATEVPMGERTIVDMPPSPPTLHKGKPMATESDARRDAGKRPVPSAEAPVPSGKSTPPLSGKTPPAPGPGRTPPPAKPPANQKANMMETAAMPEKELREVLKQEVKETPAARIPATENKPGIGKPPFTSMQTQTGSTKAGGRWDPMPRPRAPTVRPPTTKRVTPKPARTSRMPEWLSKVLVIVLGALLVIILMATFSMLLGSQ